MSLALARRYARALADVIFAEKLPPARQRRRVMRVKQEVAEFGALLRTHGALGSILANPAVVLEQKLGLLDTLCRRLKLSATARNFFAVLIEHRRLALLNRILPSLDAEIYRRLGTVPIQVTSAMELSTKQKKDLEARLRRLTGGEVELHFRQKPEILSGGVVRLGSTIYDGSLRAQLHRLQRQLASE